MISAQDAFNKTCSAHDHIDISEDLEKIEARIIAASEKGGFAVYSEVMDYDRAERVSVVLDGLGYWTSTQNAQMVKDGKQQSYIIINWKVISMNTRERLN